MKFIDMTGKRYGDWLVVSKGPIRRFKSGRSQRLWLARCSCGATAWVQGGQLRSGESTKCRKCSCEIKGASESKRIEDGRTIAGIARAAGLKLSTVDRRYRRGWPLWALGVVPGVVYGFGVDKDVRP